MCSEKHKLRTVLALLMNFMATNDSAIKSIMIFQITDSLMGRT